LDQNALAKEELATIAGMMKHNSAHLDRMVLMLYDSSDQAASEEQWLQRNEQVSPNKVARECIEHTLSHFPDLPIHFETDLDDDCSIQSNYLYLMRTLRELLYNSAKYSDKKHISLRVTATDKMIRFITEDVGAGIPEGSYDLIFNPFTKVDDLSEGLGLGLPLSKRHAKSLGGDLILDTSYHDGCRFILELPR
jgi:signal transduction histidine kinase